MCEKQNTPVWGWCSINDGVPLTLYDTVRNVVDKLYDAMVYAYAIGELHYKDLKIVFPSGLVIYIVQNWVVPDFRLPQKLFWAIRFSVFGMPMYLPLPKIPWKDIKTWLFRSLDISISGSEDWNFLDYDGVVRHGHDCTPPRTYKFLTDGTVDFGPFILGMTLAVVLYKLGLLQAAWHLVKSIWSFIVNYHHRHLERDIMEKLEKLEGSLVGQPAETNISLEEIGVKLRYIETELQSLITRVGIRYALH